MSADLPAGGRPAGSLISSLLAFAAVGGGASLLYRAVPAAIGALARQCLVTVEVRNEEVFAWVADWIGQLSYGTTCRLLAVELLRLRSGDVTGRKPLLIFAPGRGMHLFRHRGRFFWLQRGIEASVPTNGAGRPREYFVFRTVGRNPVVVRDILAEAASLFEGRRVGKVAVWFSERHIGWTRLDQQPARSLESVVLREGVKEALVADVARFLERGAWYAQVGIPYRRGYLFHGPPGCGKTSMALALAPRGGDSASKRSRPEAARPYQRARVGHFGLDIYMLSLGSPDMCDERLFSDLAHRRPRSLLLLEDVDAVFRKRRPEDDNRSGVTFSGLLNAIDGVAAPENPSPPKLGSLEKFRTVLATAQ